MSEATKYEFCSKEWVSVARDYLVAAVGDADLGDGRFSFCEVFTDPPAHLLEPGESTIGWYVSVADGELSVEKGVLPATVAQAAHVRVTRVEPEIFVPPRPGQPVRRAVGERREEALLSFVPRDRRKTYDVRKLLELVLDAGSVFELGRYFGRPVLTGLARLRSSLVA